MLCTHTHVSFMFYSQLFRRDKTRSPNPHELLRIFRFPTSEGREIARAAEKIEQTLNIVRNHVDSGMIFNLTCKYISDCNVAVVVMVFLNACVCMYVVILA